MECPNSVEVTKLHFHESTETEQNGCCEESTLSLLTPQKNSLCPLNQDQGASPILESTLFKIRDRKQFRASTPANVSSSVNSPDCESDSVIDILDRLCSPILGKPLSVSASSKYKYEPPPDGDCPANKSKQCRPKLQKKRKRLFYDTLDSKSINNQLAKKVKFESDCGKESSNEKEASCSNNDLFKHHDVSENTLQVICDITEDIVEHNSSDHCKSEKSVAEIPTRVQSCIRRESPKKKDFPMYEKSLDSDSKLLTQIDFDEKTLIYPATNSNIKAIKKITMNDLLFGTKVLEEGNRSQKVNKITNEQTKIKYGPVKEFSSSNVCVKKSGDDYIQDTNEMKEQVLSFEKNSSLNSVSISDTQFCEAVDAAEIITHLDLTFNKFTLEYSDSSEKLLKGSKEMLQHDIHNSSNLEIVQPTEQGFEISSNTIINIACSESSVHTEGSKLECYDEESHEKGFKTLCEGECGKTKALDSVEQRPTHKNKIFKIDNGSNVDFLQKPLQKTVCFNVKEERLQPNMKDFQTKCRHIDKGDEESIKEGEQLIEKEFHSTLDVPSSERNNHSHNHYSTIPINTEAIKLCESNGLKCERQHTYQNLKEKIKKLEEFDMQQIRLVENNYESNLEDIDLCKSDDINEQTFKTLQIKHTTLYDDKNKAVLQTKGFQTANGGSILISKESLDKARKLFEDGSETPTEIQGFQTESGKSILISEDSLDKTKRLSGDSTESTTGMKGFQTASRKSVQISEESLDKAKKLFDTTETIKGMKGFQTASGKSVQISKESLDKARKLFEDSTETKTGQKGFQAANGNSVNIAEESLDEARKLIKHDIETTTEIKGFQFASLKSISIYDESFNKAAKLFEDSIETRTKGFQTASGKSVQVTKESLKKARKLFEDSTETITGMKGFQTASGKSVQVAEESLNKARKLFEDSNEAITGMKGFQTASGKSVEVAEKSLNTAIKLFEDSTETITGMKAFPGASGKSVEVAKESLNKAIKLFEDRNETITGIKGFQTASGKSVQVAEESLNKARKLFEESNETITGIKGFQTASGKSVEVAEESLNKARKLFEDRNETITGIKGFQAASGKSVEVAEKSLNTAIKLFEDSTETITGMKAFPGASGKSVEVAKESLNKAIKLFEDRNETITGIKGFQTASGKSVQVAEESLNKGRKLFEESNETITGIKGFQTASGKSVEVAEESLNKARKLFEDRNETITGIKGFQAASGKSVEVAEESLNKARKLFEESNETITEMKGFHSASGKSIQVAEESLNNARKLFEDNTETITGIKGFQTASGKSVEVAEESLNKARKLFEDRNETIAGIKGFQTASGKSVEVAEESLNKARKLFEDRNETITGIKGFQTASGKSVEVAEESLKKARKLFEDSTETITGMKGFQTASGKSVQVAEESLNKARKLFEDSTETITGIKGFQTASGKSVEVVEESLNKARKLFEDRNETITGIKGFQPASGTSVQVADESLNKARKLLQDSTETTIGMKGFQTASGKSVEVAEESLNKARKLFEDSTETITGMKGFQTASGKSVQVAEESLSKARKLFDDSTETISGIKGVLNISGKSDQISEESLKKARKLFEGEIGKSTLVNGFQTAGGKSVSISEDSLKIARELFEDGIEITTETKGFRTASGENVQISENCLNEGRKECKHKIKTAPGIKSFQTVRREGVEVSEELINDMGEFSDKHSNFESENSSKKKLFDINLCVKSDHSNKVVINPRLKDSDHCSNLVSPPILKRTKRLEECINNASDESEKSAYKTPNFKTPKIQRKLIFSPFCSSGQKMKNLEGSNLEIDYSTNACSSVISEDDLSLLNQSLTNLRSDISLTRILRDENNRCYQVIEEACGLTPEVAQEVSDSMAALIADEASTSPFCKSLLLRPMLTSPSMMFERNVKLPSIDCDDKETHLNDKPLSPVLDAYSRFKPKKYLKKRTLDFSPYGKSNQHESTPTSKTGSFKPPYATSTPIGNVSLSKVKHKWQGTELLTPEVKRFKLDSGLQSSSRYEANMDNVIKARENAAERQEQIVKDKMTSDTAVKACKGSYLLRTQTEKRRMLRDLSGGKPLKTYSSKQLLKLGVQKSVIELTRANAEHFRFNALDYYSEETVKSSVEGLPVGDGALLILDEVGEAGVTELTRSFLSSPAVAPRLLPQGWVLNHLRWILLKLAATQRLFPHLRLLTPNNVMLQLKYRYDREIDRCERPALRKVLEKDESPAKPMLLFVADIHTVEGRGLELELSDGWYSVRTCVDHEMELLVRRGVVSTGTKLLTQGAELINCADGCHPLEAPPEVRLKIWSNSTRRARWFARLGFCRQSLPPLRLRGVLGRGGAIQALTAAVIRLYPLLYREKLADGTIVVRGEKAEEAAAELHQQQRQQCAETILTRLQGDQSLDPEELLGTIPDQIQSDEKAMKMQQLIQDKLLKELDEKIPPRVVARMLKVRLAESEHCEDRSALLTLWNPSDQVLSFFSEGSPLIVHNLTATGYSRFGEVQLSANRQTRFSPQTLTGGTAQSTRVHTSLVSLRPNFKALFSEIDVVGLVLPLQFDNPNTVYIADDNCNFLCISFWIELKGTGYLSVLKPGRVVAVSNLRWHAHLVSWNLPSAFATEVSVVSQHPRQSHLRPAVSQLVLCLENRDLAAYMEDCVKRIKSLIVERDSAGVLSKSHGRELSTPVNSTDDGQDVESPAVRRIARLERYGEPPPLSPIVFNTPARLRLGFRPPVKRDANKTTDDR